MTVSVFERRGTVHNLGAGIVCWPNATFVLSELGILDELSTVAGGVTSMRRATHNDIALGTLNIRDLDAAMGFPSLSVLREDLMRILLEQVEQCDIPIHYAAHATGVERVGDACRVQFADGSSVSPRIIVGADGRMNSVARQYITNDNQPVYQGFVNWIGIHRWDKCVFDCLEIRDYWGVGARFGIVPVSSDTAYWAGGIAAPESFLTNDSNQIAQLRQSFRGWPSQVGDIVFSAANSNTKCVALYDHDPVPCWHRDNVMMIGDAAHAALPTSGQGAAQALEDAWFLAREFAALPNDPENAMARFTERRSKKTSGIIIGGRNFASNLFGSDAEACALRDRNAQQTDYASLVAGMATGWSAGLPIGG